MSLDHISDERIQAYLDRGEAKRDAEVVRHIRQCPECRTKLREYRLLYRGLEVTDETYVSDSFTANTMRSIRELPAVSPQEGRSGWIFGLFGALAVIAAVVYFFGASWMESLLETIASPLAWQGRFSVFDTILRGIGGLQDGATIISGAAVILVAAALLDKAIAKAKLRKMSPLSL